jgi:hypothetical protein
MNKLTILFGLSCIIVAAYAYGHGSSYVTRHEEHHGSGGHGGHGGHHEEHYPDHHPAYKFEYGVKDEKTKDHKSHWEHRDGDKVHGEYTLDEADGTKRIVTYSSDKKSGFTAHVQKIGHATHDYGHGGHGGHGHY